MTLNLARRELDKPEPKTGPIVHSAFGTRMYEITPTGRKNITPKPSREIVRAAMILSQSLAAEETESSG